MYKFIWSEYGQLSQEGADLRVEVFMDEQGFTYEMDELDKVSYHPHVVDENGVTVGCSRVFSEPDGETYNIGRVVVKKIYRGKGLGAIVMNESKNKIQELGGKRIILGAQYDKKGFYERLGYSVCGDTYFDEHCKHVHMDQKLK